MSRRLTAAAAGLLIAASVAIAPAYKTKEK